MRSGLSWAETWKTRTLLKNKMKMAVPRKSLQNPILALGMRTSLVFYYSRMARIRLKKVTLNRVPV
jgi:hypothetical protein